MLKKMLLSIFGKTDSSTELFENTNKFTEEIIKELDPYLYEINQKKYKESIEIENLPDIIKKGRTKHFGKNLVDLHSEYFNKMPNTGEVMNESTSENIYEGLLLIEPMAMYENLRWGSFHIKSIPIIEYGLKYYQGLKNPVKIKDLKELIDFIPELHFYSDEANESFDFCLLLPQLMDFIKSKKGITIKDLPEIFPDKVELIKNKLYYLVKYGSLKKRKEGKYNFYEIIE